MKAIVYTNYGAPDVLELREVEKPTPQAGEILVKVHAASANAGDWRLLRGAPFLVRLDAGLLRPKVQILGADVAGRVVAVGSNVTRFRPGDAVFGDLSAYGYGGFAEYVSASADAFVSKPANLTFEQAAATPVAAVTALQGLRDQGQIQPGQTVLINGASGSVGSFAVQIAKALGAEVTGVCSTRKMEMVRSLGANHVIDYTQEDFTQNGQQYDLILDTAAYRSIADYKRSLRPTGIYVLVGGSGGRFLQAMVMGPWLSKKGGQRFGAFVVKPNQTDLAFVKDLLETGKVVPYIDRCYPLPEAGTALGYLEAGRATGKVIIAMA